MADVKVDGPSVGSFPRDALPNVTANHTIDASFAIDVYTITATAGAHGSITPSGTVSVDCGSDQAFSVAADACYHIADGKVDGTSVGAVASDTVTHVPADHTIDAS